ncbi:MAG TPA: DUF1801 domain-containing protein [Ferruginibacter sp.]|nr:DUF1801 domain-containing protein [Ferruginibacter sp.]
MKGSTKMPTPKNVDEYISSFPAATAKKLEQVRKTIRAAAPKAEEVISYKIPGYTCHGMLVFFACWKNHISIYPAPWEAAALKKEMSAYEGSKGTIKFPLDKPLPLALISKMVKFRLKANEEKAALKKTVKAKPAVKTGSAKPSDEDQVKAYISNLEKKVKTEIAAVRKIIKGASEKLAERIKWNAPSYYYKQDILTFGPYKTHKLLLVFHHPAVVKIKSLLLEGDYKDRRLVYFKDKAEAEKNKKELSRIITEIIKAIDNK